MLSYSNFTASIGVFANKILTASAIIFIRGVTSRGIFLATAADWVVFLSTEPFRGPLTINLPAMNGLDRIQINDKVSFKDNILHFHPTNLIVDLNHTDIYSTPPITRHPPADTHRLPNWPLATAHPLYTRAQQIRDARRELDYELVEAGCQALFGHGEGLTPEGDDFVLGLLYSLGQIETSSQQAASLCQNLVQTAKTKTTTLSANLIECAAQGQVDERIHAALQAILHNSTNQEEAIAALLRWGNTSGQMVLAGLLAGIG